MIGKSCSLNVKMKSSSLCNQSTCNRIKTFHVLLSSWTHHYMVRVNYIDCHVSLPYSENSSMSYWYWGYAQFYAWHFNQNGNRKSSATSYNCYFYIFAYFCTYFICSSPEHIALMRIILDTVLSVVCLCMCNVR